MTQPGKYSEVYEGLKSGELLELEVLDTVGTHRGNVLCEIIGQTLDSEQGLPILHVYVLAGSTSRAESGRPERHPHLPKSC